MEMIEPREPVYVAYIDGTGVLEAVHAISHLPHFDLWFVLEMDAVAHLHCQQIVGPVAELLFISVTGRLWDEHPETADPELALLARQALAEAIDVLPGAAEAYAAIATWGDYVCPWYGVWALDEAGCPVLGDPRYEETLDIPLCMPVS